MADIGSDQLVAAPTHSFTLLEQTLQLAEQRWELRRAPFDESMNTMLWLRAGRAGWLLGDLSQAQSWYRRAADGLLDVCLSIGLSTGTFAYYAETTLGVVALTGSVTVVERVTGEIYHQIPQAPAWSRRRGTRTSTADPSVAGHELVRAWGAWLAGDERTASQALLAAGRTVRTFSVHVRQRWELSRWYELESVLTALLDRQAPELRAALLRLDARLFASRDGGALGLVDETLAALVAEWQRLHPRTYDLAGFHMAVVPGLLAPSPGTTPAAAGTAGRPVAPNGVGPSDGVADHPMDNPADEAS